MGLILVGYVYLENRRIGIIIVRCFCESWVMLKDSIVFINFGNNWNIVKFRGLICGEKKELL